VRGRRIARVVAALGIAALTGSIAACADAPSAPASLTPNGPHRATSITSLVPAQALLRTAPLAQTVVYTKTVPRSGGGISVPGTDFQLQIPNGAFAEKSITFTITAYAGSAVAYDFQPHGTVFLKPLKAVQQLGHTNWKSFNLPAGYYPNWAGGYFADVSQLNLTTGSALINEFMPGGVNVGGATMTWDVPHFSGYMVSTGRQ
jgi:hypothetical protein